MNQSEVLELIKVAEDAAREAGALIKAKATGSVDHSSKRGGSSLASQVVTEVDHASEEIILRHLQPTLGDSIGLLTEERVDDSSRLIRDYFWCIDPLDGTLPFIEKKPGFSVSIGLVRNNGKPLAGVVCDPSTMDIISGGESVALQKNGEAYKLDLPDSRVLSVSRDRSSFEASEDDKLFQALEKMANALGFSDVEILEPGGAVLNAVWLLERRHGCYFKFPKPQDGGGSLWDFAATAALFKACNLDVSDIFGNPLNLNETRTTFLNHCGVLFATKAEIAEQVMTLYREFAEPNNTFRG